MPEQLDIAGTEPKTVFPCILMDPPWSERGGGKIVRGAQRHYPLIETTKGIESVIRSSGLWRPAENAHLYCWVTNNYLPHGLELVARLGFRYVTNVCWHKTQAGIGQYFRGKHELMLFGVRGSGFDVATSARDLVSCIGADHVRRNGRRVHSAKPVEFYELIEARTEGPRVEFFARSNREGWVSWGNEVQGAA